MKKILFLFAIFLFATILYGMPVNAECSSSTNTGVPCWDPDTGDWLCYSSETCISGYCYETSYAAPGTSCSDGRSCTTGETCDGSGNCGGGTVSCYSPPGVCYSSSGSCDVNGNCAYPYASSGTSCGTSTCPADYCSGAYYYDYQPSCTRYCDGFGGCTDCCTPTVANCGITLSATCISSTTLRTYSSGTCGASGCNYPYTDTTCTYGCSGGSCNPPPAAVCGNGIVESGEYCEDAQTYTSTTTSCGSGTCAGTQSYVYNCISSTCQWNAGAWTACSSQGNVCSTGSCILSSGTCGTGSQSVTRCDSSGGCTSSSSQSCTVGCSSGYTCSGGTCVSTGDTTPPTSSITSPAAGSTQSSNFVVSVSDSDTGGSGLASCDYYVYDSTAGYTVPSGTSRTCNSGFTVTVGSSGNCRTVGTNTCIVGVSSRDNANNQMSPYNTRTFSISFVDTTPPTVGTTSPTAAAVGVATTFSASVSDNVAVTSCSLYVGGSNVGSMSLSAAPCVSCTASRSYTFAAAGSYSMYASCSDGAGNSASGTSVTVGVVTPFPSPSCTTTEPSKTISNIGNTCSVTVTSRARDYTDYSIVYYRNTVYGGSDITTEVEDNDDCDMDLQFSNSWTIPATNRISITSTKLADDCTIFGCGNKLAYGYTISTGACSILSFDVCPIGGPPLACPSAGVGVKTANFLVYDDTSSFTNTFTIGECLTNADCTFDSNRPTCDTTTNMCIANIGTPTLISPSNGATTSLTPILTVDTVTNANRYYFYVGDTLGNVIDSFCSLSTQDPILSGTLSSGTTYIWSAKACTDSSCNTCGSYAASWSFTTLGTPTLISPSNGATTSITPILDASDVTNANSYYFYARTATETIGTATERYCSPVSEDVPLGLSSNIQYYWSAKACTDSSCNTCGNYAPEWSFSTSQCNSALNLPDGTNSQCSGSTPYCSPENRCVECFSNDRTDGTSTQCYNKAGYQNQYLSCVNYACKSGPCGLNSNCDAGYCCDKSEDVPGGLPSTLRKAGTCVQAGSTSGIIQPYLCTQG